SQLAQPLTKSATVPGARTATDSGTADRKRTTQRPRVGALAVAEIPDYTACRALVVRRVALGMVEDRGAQVPRLQPPRRSTDDGERRGRLEGRLRDLGPVAVAEPTEKVPHPGDLESEQGADDDPRRDAVGGED